MPEMRKPGRLVAAGVAVAMGLVSVQSPAASSQAEISKTGKDAAASHYPPVGRVATVDFGNAVFRLNFLDDRTMAFADVSGAFQGVQDTVEYTAVEVSKNVFMVYWHEPTTGSNVVHVQDWNTGTVYTNIAMKDGSFTHLKGTIKIQ